MYMISFITTDKSAGQKPAGSVIQLSLKTNFVLSNLASQEC